MVTLWDIASKVSDISLTPLKAYNDIYKKVTGNKSTLADKAFNKINDTYKTVGNAIQDNGKNYLAGSANSIIETIPNLVNIGAEWVKLLTPDSIDNKINNFQYNMNTWVENWQNKVVNALGADKNSAAYKVGEWVDPTVLIPAVWLVGKLWKVGKVGKFVSNVGKVTRIWSRFWKLWEIWSKIGKVVNTVDKFTDPTTHLISRLTKWASTATKVWAFGGDIAAKVWGDLIRQSKSQSALIGQYFGQLSDDQLIALAQQYWY